MPWVNPKMNWVPADGVADADFNRIEGNIDFLHSLQMIADDGNAILASGDWNNYRDSGLYMGSALANQPTPESGGVNTWKYVQVIKHANLWSIQIAWDFDGNAAWWRTYKNGVWQPWKQYETTSSVNSKLDLMKYGFITASSDVAYRSYWFKLCQVSLTTVYDYKFHLIDLVSGGTSDANTSAQSGLLYFRVKQQQPLGQQPIISLEWLSRGVGFLASDAKAVIAVNSPTETRVDLYVRIRPGYDNIRFYPRLSDGAAGTTWINGATPVQSLTGNMQSAYDFALHHGEDNMFMMQGTNSVTISNAATGLVSVTFPIAFSEAPKVMGTMDALPGGKAFFIYDVNPSPTGVTFSVSERDATAATGTASVAWVAIGKRE
jgi:hypothetical protein